MDQIKYYRLPRIKYLLAENYIHHNTGILGEIKHKYFDLEGETLIIRAGYAWDGPSGPSIDTRNFMRGSLVHDVFCQMIREGLLGKSTRKKADRLLYQICLDDGMHPLRARWVYLAVRTYATLFKIRPYPKSEMLVAPERAPSNKRRGL